MTATREETASPSVTSIEEARDRRRLDDQIRAHHGFLSSLARKLCRTSFDAEDLLQDVVMKTVAAHHRIPPDANLAAWMARTMHNLFIDRVRERAVRTSEALDERTHAAPAAETRAWWEELRAADVRAVLPRLSDELRVAFELFAFDGLTYKEIAARQGVPVATVGTRVLRARRQLRVLLGGPVREGDDE